MGEIRLPVGYIVCLLFMGEMGHHPFLENSEQYLRKGENSSRNLLNEKLRTVIDTCIFSGKYITKSNLNRKNISLICC